MTQENKTKEALSRQIQRKRKMLLVLPLLVIPFLTMAFWALGGGTAPRKGNEQAGNGLNLQLPSARLKDDKTENKLADYERAERDSDKLSALRKADPLFEMSPRLDSLSPAGHGVADTAPSVWDGTRDSNVARVYEKLNALNRQMSASAEGASSKRLGARGGEPEAELRGLEATYRKGQHSDSEPDPELDRLNQMMDKVIRIQHPHEESSDMKPAPGEHAASEHLTVASDSSMARVEMMGYDTVKGAGTQGGFYGLEDQGSTRSADNALPARVYATQTLVSGGTVKLCTQKDLNVSGVVIPKGTFLYGISNLQGERLLVHISSVRVGESLYPVRLSVYDLDGQEGIWVPGSIGRESVKSSTDQAMGGIGLTTLDPSLAAQAASAGIQAAKTLLSKKAKLVKMTLTAGYQVLLKNE